MATILKKDVELGAHYAIRHTSSAPGRLNVIRIDSECRYGGWNATNLKTGRAIRIKSNTKLRAKVEKVDGRWTPVAQ